MRLDEITMSKFIDIISGKKKAEEEIVRSLVSQYREIADPQGFRRYVINSERLIKARIANAFYVMCSNLLSVGRYDKVIALLKTVSTDLSGTSDERIEAEIASRIDKTRRDIEKYEHAGKEEETDPEKVRQGFDALTAVMMAHFKFQIDLCTIKASIYANMVSLFEREMAAMQKMKNKY